MPSTMSDTHHGPSSPVPATTDLSFQQQEQEHQEHPEHHPPPTHAPAPNYFLLLTFFISVVSTPFDLDSLPTFLSSNYTLR